GLGAGDLYRGDCRAVKGGQQHASKGVPNGVTVAGLKRLGGELCISICGRALVFCESFRHFKTTVTDWHILVSDCRLPICDLKRERRALAILLTIEIFNLKSAMASPGSPWRAQSHIQRRKPRDQRRNFKNSLRTWNKD